LLQPLRPELCEQEYLHWAAVQQNARSLGLFKPAVLLGFLLTRWLLMWSLTFGTRCACRAPTEIVPGVSLAIDQVAPRADRRSLFSAFTVSIASSGSAWIPACGGVIRPDVAVMIRGQRVDTDSGSLCTADRTTGPAPIAPGARYIGQSTVQTAANARFVPHVVVGLTRSLGAPVRHVVGTPFEAE
jgi:hypothetical protein